MIPLLEAELDRDLVRRESILAEREAEIMKNKADWSAMDLKAAIPGIGKYGKPDEHAAEPVYHTKRYVRPSLVFLPPSEEKNVLESQWWRGSKVLTKVLYDHFCDLNRSISILESSIPKQSRFYKGTPNWSISRPSYSNKVVLRIFPQ